MGKILHKAKDLFDEFEKRKNIGFYILFLDIVFNLWYNNLVKIKVTDFLERIGYKRAKIRTSKSHSQFFHYCAHRPRQIDLG
jgi:hypothetical protein